MELTRAPRYSVSRSFDSTEQHRALKKRQAQYRGRIPWSLWNRYSSRIVSADLRVELCSEMSERMQHIRDQALLIAIAHFLTHGHEHRERLPATAPGKLLEPSDQRIDACPHLGCTVPRFRLRFRDVVHG